jgi:hypothetical protein
MKPWRAVGVWLRAAYRTPGAPSERDGDTAQGLGADYTRQFMRDPYTGALRLAAKRKGDQPWN